MLRDTHVLIAGGGLSRSWSGHERLARGVFVCGGVFLAPKHVLVTALYTAQTFSRIAMAAGDSN